MTIQAISLLMKLKKAQRSENQKVVVDTLSMMVYTYGVLDKEAVNINLEKEWPTVLSRIETLEAENLLKNVSCEKDCDYPLIQVNHNGFHYWQTTISKILNFLMKSVLVPIVVAFFTALFTVMLTA